MGIASSNGRSGTQNWTTLQQYFAPGGRTIQTTTNVIDRMLIRIIRIINIVVGCSKLGRFVGWWSFLLSHSCASWVSRTLPVALVPVPRQRRLAPLVPSHCHPFSFKCQTPDNHHHYHFHHHSLPKMDTELLETDNFLNLVSLPCDQDEPVEAATTTVAATTTTTGEETPPTAAAPHPQLAYSAVPRKTKEMIQEWRKITENFAKQVLDPCYLNLPIRSTTIKGAALYPATRTTFEQQQQEQTNQPLPPSLLPGTHKHLGGAYDPTDGCIYGVPANSRAVLCLYYVPEQNTYRLTTIPLPPHIVDVRFKWLRGIFAHGYLWAIPSWANAVLCVDVDAFWGRRPAQPNENGTDIMVHLIPLPPEHPEGLVWQWHGAGINHEKTAIYCIPSNVPSVLKVDLLTKTTSLIDIDYDPSKYPNLDLTNCTNKWYGGIVGDDNCIYGIPYRACGVLQIDCNTDTATLIGPDYGVGQYNWHGGIKVNGKIYAHPSHADTVLVIDTTIKTGGQQQDSTHDDQKRVYELPIHRATYDTDPRKNYKWLGGTVGLDGNIYCPACDTSAVLKIDTSTDTCRTFGFCGTSKNKWQGGVLSPRDGCIYCIPASGTQVLRIIPGADVVQLLGDLAVHKDKWQGGHVGKDGCLYFIPENGYRVLKVIPAMRPPKLIPKHDDDGNRVMHLDPEANSDQDTVELELI